MKSQFDSYAHFKRFAVPASNVQDFLQRYSKPKAHALRGSEHVALRIKSYQRELQQYGFCFITHHDSVTGEIVAYYPDLTNA